MAIKYLHENPELVVINSNMIPPVLKFLGVQSMLLDRHVLTKGLPQEDIEKIMDAVLALASN
ncbi:MAG TPA: hypothetical protein PK733_10365 [Clostridiales bacterium]|nr:hypothetical protein [Clostridiales bacterium]